MQAGIREKLILISFLGHLFVLGYYAVQSTDVLRHAEASSVAVVFQVSLLLLAIVSGLAKYAQFLMLPFTVSLLQHHRPALLDLSHFFGPIAFVVLGTSFVLYVISFWGDAEEMRPSFKGMQAILLPAIVLEIAVMLWILGIILLLLGGGPIAHA